MNTLAESVRAIFEDNSADFMRRVATVEQAVAAIQAGGLREPLRACAESDAHKLSGALGTFGLPRGSQLASELEQRFAAGERVPVSDGAHLAQIVRTLRSELEAQIAGRGSGLSYERPAGRAEAELDLGVDGSDSRGGRFDGPQRSAATPPSARKVGRILVVDDDMPVREVLTAILSDAGYDVRHVGSAKEARHALEHDTIALLLSDVSMPGETGLDLIRFALCEHPETATLLISALEDPGIAQVAMDFGAYGYVSKPVRRSAVLIGVMNALRRRDMEVRERAARQDLDRVVAQRTSALSLALEQLEGASEYARVLQAETIYRWARSAEYRDPGAGGHVRRMSRYCSVLAPRFGLDGGSLELASALHDVGKVAISDGILLKPAPLTTSERLQIECHAEIGYGILRDSSSSVLDLAAVIARTHHERFDGGGYPRRLAGSDIPIEGRIAAVADVFDALTCDRSYRAAWSVEDTIATMKAARGTHFDPQVLDAFLDAIDDILAIKSLLGDGS